MGMLKKMGSSYLQHYLLFCISMLSLLNSIKLTTVYSKMNKQFSFWKIKNKSWYGAKIILFAPWKNYLALFRWGTFFLKKGSGKYVHETEQYTTRTNVAWEMKRNQQHNRPFLPWQSDPIFYLLFTLLLIQISFFHLTIEIRGDRNVS